MVVEIPTQFQTILTWVAANPALAGGAFLAAALLADWGLGVIRAVATKAFAWARLSNILKSQLATREMLAIGGLLGASYLAHSSDPGMVEYLIDAVGVAATLYAVPTWRDCAPKLRDIAVALFGRDEVAEAEPIVDAAVATITHAVTSAVAETKATGTPPKTLVFGVPRTGEPGPGVNVGKPNAPRVFRIAPEPRVLRTAPAPTPALPAPLPNPNPVPP